MWTYVVDNRRGIVLFWEFGASLHTRKDMFSRVSTHPVLFAAEPQTHLDECDNFFDLLALRVLLSSRKTKSFTLPTETVVPVSKFLMLKLFSATSAGSFIGVGSYFS